MNKNIESVVACKLIELFQDKSLKLNEYLMKKLRWQKDKLTLPPAALANPGGTGNDFKLREDSYKTPCTFSSMFV